MHVITRRTLRQFWEKYPASQTPLNAWHRDTRSARWRKFADVKAAYPSADTVSPFTVFNIGGNKYRLITVIDYRRHKVYIRDVLTHDEYDKGKWRRE